jgi:hypothetical protein
VRYILTYTETNKGTTGQGNRYITANTDTEAIKKVEALLKDKDVTDITLWRRGDFVILGRESI